MATRQTHAEQQRLGTHGVHDFDRGDLLEVTQHGTSSPKIRLTECPFCAADPNRPRHHFAAQQSPAAHVANEHDWSELSIVDNGLLQQNKRVSGD